MHGAQRSGAERLLAALAGAGVMLAAGCTGSVEYAEVTVGGVEVVETVCCVRHDYVVEVEVLDVWAAPVPYAEVELIVSDTPEAVYVEVADAYGFVRFPVQASAETVVTAIVYPDGYRETIVSTVVPDGGGTVALDVYARPI